MDSEKFDFAEGVITEVELNAQDLLELSSPGTAEGPSHSVGPQAVQAHAAEVTTATVAPVQMRSASLPSPLPSPSLRRISVPRIGMVVSFAVGAITLIGVHYADSTQNLRVQSPTAISQPASVPSHAPASTPDVERPPMHFANPFDKSEVFEFPAGTSRDEARALVADLLIKRAMERQH